MFSSKLLINPDLEDMQLDYEEKCNDAEETRQEVRAAQLEAQKFRLRLRALECKAAPASLPAAKSPAELRREADLFRFVSWVAQHVDLDVASEQCFETTLALTVSGRYLCLSTAVQWAMPSAPGGRMSVTVPASMAEEFRSLLQQAKATGAVASAEALAMRWELVPGNFKGEPVVLLADRLGGQLVYVSAWLTEVAKSQTDAVKSQLAPLEARGTQAAAAERAQALPAVGERVKIIYEGEWYDGDVVSVNGNCISVHCDSDPEDVVTDTLLSTLVRIASHAPMQVSQPGDAAEPEVSTSEGQAVEASSEPTANSA